MGWSVIALVFFAIFSAVMLPAMNPEFGGARERLAMFDLDPADISNATAERIWPDQNLTEIGHVVRTPIVRVLFANADVVLVRPLEEDSASGPLFELPRTTIKTIVWVGGPPPIVP
jgi:hypothetical protein